MNAQHVLVMIKKKQMIPLHCIFKNKENFQERSLMKKSKLIEIFILIFLSSYLSLNKNLNQIQFLQSQIRKFLQSKKKENNKVFNRPQNKSKKNYLFLNSEDAIDIENKNPNIENNQNSQIEKEMETQGEIEKVKLNNQDDDSFLNNEIKYVENLRIQNAVYTGEVLNGKRHGKGIQVWDDGAKYEGNWENDKSNGYGTFYHTDGDVYQGYWKNNRANGKGVYISSDGGRYEGYWIDDVQNGFGTEKWNDGSSYQGNYDMGKKEGYGEYEWSNKSKYRGYWKDNKLCGKGVYYYVDGKKYIGDYNNNLKDGIGKYFWTDGKIYFGQQSQDKKEGIGKYNWNDGRVYIGFWKLNKQNGLGRYINASENKDKFGIWVDGKRSQWIEEDIFGQMEKCILGNFIKIKKKELVNILGMMEEFIQDFGN